MDNMNSLIGIPRKRVPSDFAAAQRFSQESSLGIAAVLLSFPMLVTLLVLISLLRNMSRGAMLPMDELVPAIVVLLPLLLWTVPYFLRQWLQRKRILEGNPAVGAFFGADALLWCTKPNFCHYIPKNSLRTVLLQGRMSAMSPGSRGTCIPDWMELRGANFAVRIPGVMEYKLLDLVRYLRTWNPDVAITIDPRLNWPR